LSHKKKKFIFLKIYSAAQKQFHLKDFFQNKMAEFIGFHIGSAGYKVGRPF
jgi:hypothetical protein